MIYYVLGLDGENHKVENVDRFIFEGEMVVLKDKEFNVLYLGNLKSIEGVLKGDDKL